MKKILNNYSSKNDINIRQIVAYKDNVLEIEEYREGFTKEDTMNIMSVTKSITSLLIGIAIDKGFIKRIPDKRKKRIEITEKGAKTAQKVMDYDEEWDEKIKEITGVEEYNTYKETLKKISEALI